MNWTPGPWEVAGDDVFSDSFHGALIVTEAKSRRVLSSQREANLHLTAAAPDLYEALERTLDFLPHRGGDTGPLEQARAALAKARGRGAIDG